MCCLSCRRRRRRRRRFFVGEVILFNVDLDKGCTVVIQRQGRLKF